MSLMLIWGVIVAAGMIALAIAVVMVVLNRRGDDS